MILVSLRTIAGHQFSDKTGKKQLGTDHDSQQRQIEQRLIRHISVHCTVGYADKLVGDKIYGDEKSYNKAQHPYRTEKVHWSFAKLADKDNRHQIQKALDEPSGTELGLAVLAWIVLHDLLLNIREACPLGNHRNVAMHLSIYFYGFHHILLISFQPAVEVVQIMNT